MTHRFGKLVLLGILMALTALAISFAAPPPSDAARWQYVDQLNAQSYQLFVREWGRLTAICSAGAYFTDGKITRLLTAGHCVALSQLEMGQAVELLVTQSGSEFQPARILATGWKVKEAYTSGGRALSEVFAKLPTVRQARDPRLDVAGGDWAILEIDGKKPAAAPGDSDALKEDDAVYIYGYPLGGDRFFARGYIANRNYKAPQTEWPAGYVAADVTAAPGNSGSMLVDENGRAVAILVAGSGDRLHILTPINMVKKAVPCMADPVCQFSKP